MTIFEYHIHNLPAKPMDWMVEDYAEELGILEKNMADFFDFDKFYLSDMNLWNLIAQSNLLKKPTAESNKQVTKLIAGEVYVDTLGEEQTLTVYSMEPSLIPDPEEWLAKMTARWEVLIRQFSSDATISAELFDYEG
ncbi:Putative uncharacterized protein [Moritella viscosa]|uniref:hypothetical protein n=1 Tax=Moritella viscosa TaxID=80854 RepID=UPI00091069D5|nr:hypothetical protein [Moritella viscosa]SGY81785.1 Putative uncharacterized protein [Moritella viscosa]